jgi:hypothetical protein
MSGRYGLYPCTFNNALHFTQLGSASCSPGVNLNEFFPAGQTYRHAAITGSAAPSFAIRTTDLLTPFGTPTVSPLLGYNCTNPSVFRYQQRADGGTFLGVGAGNHMLATCNLGFLAPSRISVEQDSPALAEFTFWPLFDGTNAPIVFADGALAQTADWVSTYYLGPVVVDDDATATVLRTLTSLSIDFGLDYRTLRADGDVWARNGYIYQNAPVITLTFQKVGLLDSSSPAEGNLSSVFGQLVADPTISIYLYRGGELGAGTREAVGDADHCRIRVFAGEWHPDSIEVAEEGDASVTVTLRPLYDGSNALITIDATNTAVAVS